MLEMVAVGVVGCSLRRTTFRMVSLVSSPLNEGEKGRTSQAT